MPLDGTIDQHFIPEQDNAVDVGTSGRRFRNVYGQTVTGTTVTAGSTNVGTTLSSHTTSLATSVNAQSYSVNRALSAAGVAIGTDTTKIKAAATVTYMVAGQIYTKSTADHWTLTGAVFGGAAITARGYLLTLNAAGTGAVTATANATGASEAAAIAALVWPALPASTAVVGYFTVATDGLTAFTPGTSVLSAAGYTEAYADGAPPALIAAF